MKRSSIIEQRRKSVNPETRRAVDFSFLIVDRIHEILERKGMRQKDLAMRLGEERTRNQQVDAWNAQFHDRYTYFNRGRSG